MTATEKGCAAGISDVGRRRSTNEDAILVLPDAGLFCVADGQGGVRAGEVASKAVVEALAAEACRSGDAWKALELHARVACIRATMGRVNGWIRQQAREHGFHRMTSTLVAVVLDPLLPGHGMALYSGDSRLYRLRDGNLERVTEDHTYGSEQAADDNRDFPHEGDSYLTSSIGLRDQVVLVAMGLSLKTGDLLVLCSAGLTRMLPDQALRRVLRRNLHAGVHATAQALVDEANAAGGDDNISVVVVDPGSVPGEPVTEPVETSDSPAGRFVWAAGERLGGRTKALALLTALVVAALAATFAVLNRLRERDMQAAIGPRQADRVEAVGERKSAASSPALPAPLRVTNPAPAAFERALETGKWEAPQQVAAWAGREEQAVAVLGDLNQRIPLLLAALGGRSSITNAAEVVAAFAEYQRRIAVVRQWAVEQTAAGRTVNPAGYPSNDIRIATIAGDLAWQELYVMIEPLDEAAVTARTHAAESLYQRIDRIVELWEMIVADRREYPDVHSWRERANLSRVGTLLAAVEDWVKSPGAGLAAPAGQ